MSSPGSLSRLAAPPEEDAKRMKYLTLLSKQYPTMQHALNAIISLETILNLPRGTELFLSDIHGENEPFAHVMKNGSGVIRRAIKTLFSDSLTIEDQKRLATLIYYPTEKIPLCLAHQTNSSEWYRVTLLRCVKVLRHLAANYSRRKVRKYFPPEFANVMDELITSTEPLYANGIVRTIVELNQGTPFLVSVSRIVKRLAVTHLHVLGDIFDRGPAAHLCMEAIMDRHSHSVDIQWGNHDILWMGAAAGSLPSIACVIRNSLAYSNTETLEVGYGINLLPLALHAMKAYANDPCTAFMPKSVSPGATGLRRYDPQEDRGELQVLAKMHKAIAIILFKLEGQCIARNKHFMMMHRRLLHRIDIEKGTVFVPHVPAVPTSTLPEDVAASGEQDRQDIPGETYMLRDTNFPTVDWAHPYELSPEEQEVIERLRYSFLHSETLQRHVRFLYAKGSMYLRWDGNLLFHGCIPLNADRSFTRMHLFGGVYWGRSFLDRMDRLAREGYFLDAHATPERKAYGLDVLWYLWCGPMSPLFGKNKISTFERLFISGPSPAHHEEKNPYYEYREDQATVRAILDEFDLNAETGHVINGHVPVQVRSGESPLKAGGQLLVIDGGLSRAYQATTGIAGYTLVSNSRGLILVAHEPFESAKRAWEDEIDIHGSTTIVEHNAAQRRIRDTDLGRELTEQVQALKNLHEAFHNGSLKEKLTREWE
eukprot:gnl/Trimastix_PCT/2510.p1 GENE.gnl/Trimastix_PCT/2510~~gnl/Trimastix_PCT/2510.p1  ORF type:complete len:709 (+),score=261.73 gnl/Trimastix_PCT/2510:56-2182(+)